MYTNNILNFQEATTILNACIKKSELIEGNTYLNMLRLKQIQSSKARQVFFGLSLNLIL